MTADQSTAPLETPMPEPAKPDPNCWVLADVEGEHWINGDCIPHWDSEAEAKAGGVVASIAHSHTPLQLDHVCVLLECSICGAPLEDDGGAEHYPTLRVACDMAKDSGWDVTDQDAPVCEDCKDARSAPPAAPDIHPGQVPLPLGEEA